MLDKGLGLDFTYFLILSSSFLGISVSACYSNINMRLFYTYTRLTVLFGAFLLFKLAKDMEIEMVSETEIVRDMYMEIVGDGDSRRKMEIESKCKYKDRKQYKVKLHLVIPVPIYCCTDVPCACRRCSPDSLH
jgi:hypothetical protein